MYELLVYTLKSAFVLTLLYLPYTLMLRHERFFRLNRLTLLSILVLALVQPLCKFTSPDGLAQMGDAATAITHTQELVYHTETFITSHPVSTSEASDTLDWRIWIAFIYIIGVVTVFLVRLIQMVHIRQAMRCGCLWRQKESNGITVYCHVGKIAPFSWMRSIYICEKDYKQNGRAILLHEQAHINCHHSLDILLLTFVEALQWWNPFVYKLGNSLRDVHEYEADHHVLLQGISQADYQALLVRKALNNTSFAFANNFNRSHVMKRIKMMKHPKSNPWMRGKVLYLFPLMAFTMMISATPVIKPVFTIVEAEIEPDRQESLTQDGITHVAMPKDTKSTSIDSDKVQEDIVEMRATEACDSSSVPLVEEPSNGSPRLRPEFPGGMSALRSFVQKGVTKALENETSVAGQRVVVQFLVRKDGSVDDIGLLSGTDEAYYEAVKIVEQMPRWIPGRSDGKEVDGYFVLPIIFNNN